jgi:hypothetical protein
MGPEGNAMCERKKSSQNSKSSNKVSTRIIGKPSEEDLVPTEREKRLLQDLFEWQERSRKTYWVLGEPLGVRD